MIESPRFTDVQVHDLLIVKTHAIYVIGYIAFENSFGKNWVSKFKYRFSGENAINVLHGKKASGEVCEGGGTEETEYDPKTTKEFSPI